MVEEIESFSAKLELSLAPEGERSNHRCVEIDQSLALDKTTVRVPERVLSGNRECRSIEPLVFRLGKPAKGLTNHIRAFIDVGVADIGHVCAIDHGLVLPAPGSKDIVELPVAQDV